MPFVEDTAGVYKKKDRPFWGTVLHKNNQNYNNTKI
jgi:hypothetical protein